MSLINNIFLFKGNIDILQQENYLASSTFTKLLLNSSILSFYLLISLNEKNLTTELFAHGYPISSGIGANAVGIGTGNRPEVGRRLAWSDSIAERDYYWCVN